MVCSTNEAASGGFRIEPRRHSSGLGGLGWGLKALLPDREKDSRDVAVKGPDCRQQPTKGSSALETADRRSFSGLHERERDCQPGKHRWFTRKCPGTIWLPLIREPTVGDRRGPPSEPPSWGLGGPDCGSVARALPLFRENSLHCRTKPAWLARWGDLLGRRRRSARRLAHCCRLRMRRRPSESPFCRPNLNDWPAMAIDQ
jgi:hypothetical protein